MSTLLAGKGLVISVCTTTGGSYTVVNGLNDASMSISGDNQDITTFGENYMGRMQGLKDISYSLGGFLATTDGTTIDPGQLIIRTALLANTDAGNALFIKFLANGTVGYKQQVYVSSFEMSAGVDGMVELSIELEGSDDPTAV